MTISKMDVQQFTNLELRESEHADSILIIMGNDSETIATGFVYEKEGEGYTVHLLSFPQENEDEEETGGVMLYDLPVMFFPTAQEMFSFMARLPEMSALELLASLDSPTAVPEA
jgi:hypothetical protein